MINRILVTILAALACLTASAQLTAFAAFADAPSGVFPLLDRNTRLDMIDYFNAGSPKASTNNLDGQSRITTLTPTQLRVSMTDASDMQLALLPTSSNDTIIAVITTVFTPARDSQISLYSADWRQLDTGRYFTAPLLADWIIDSSQVKDVEMMMPFLIVCYDYDDDGDMVLTLSNNTSQFLGDDVYARIHDAMLDQMKYTWTGKRFNRQQ